MDIALSFCPNDTFLFHAWIEQYVGKDLPRKAHFADIETLNLWAKEKRFPLIKVSFGVLPQILDTYELLPCGAALGFNCGPKLIAKTFFPRQELRNKTIAIPGKHTTAHLLLDLLLGEVRNKTFCLYHEIYQLLSKEQVDAGLIIHESRFTFEKLGLQEIVDLGSLWEKRFSLPLPLGGIAIQRDLPFQMKKKIISILQSSLRFAKKKPELPIPFILEKAQEKEQQIVRDHIQTYVNEETMELSERGISAITTLIHKNPIEWLFSS